ncbi:uncharacterized protein HD556DRAFT_1424679 [Suillus plorans]|uniref:VPS28 N-terminal domain-containing protein n=1 Tax=Suillus plorans TaxID=116603 RepID=A0A9P7DAH6_9AGAM|nr:uncharacterized protein HD556DRAFT_1424679 [Suillus plorans]KAG1785058.1 hypothetical protein HD556DRAFT_1424679 [Suillus plorans]
MTMLKLVKDSIPSIEQSMTRYRMDNPAALHRIRVGVPATVEQRMTWRSTLIFRWSPNVLKHARPLLTYRQGPGWSASGSYYRKTTIRDSHRSDLSEQAFNHCLYKYR